MNATKRIYPVVFALLILIHTSFAFAQDVKSRNTLLMYQNSCLPRTRWRPIFLGISNFSMVCPVKLRFRKPMTFSTCREA
jgi:hypothetical protein